MSFYGPDADENLAEYAQIWICMETISSNCQVTNQYATANWYVDEIVIVQGSLAQLFGSPGDKLQADTTI